MTRTSYKVASRNYTFIIAYKQQTKNLFEVNKIDIRKASVTLSYPQVYETFISQYQWIILY